MLKERLVNMGYLLKAVCHTCENCGQFSGELVGDILSVGASGEN